MPLNIKDLRIESIDFPPLGRMGDTHAADKGNVPPRLRVSGIPEGTVELAVICHDPDAPLPLGFTHWTLYGLEPRTGEIVPGSGRPGPNGMGQNGYFGPQPPNGHGFHHYYFWVYALDCKVAGSPNREDFLEIYKDNIIEQNRIVGLYENA